MPPPHAYVYVAQNTKKTLLRWLLDSLSQDGVRTLSAMLRDRRMYAARERRLRDITEPGGFASLTGLDIWHMMGILLPLFRMCFHTRDTMVSITWRHMTVIGRWPFAIWIGRYIFAVSGILCPVKGGYAFYDVYTSNPVPFTS